MDSFEFKQLSSLYVTHPARSLYLFEFKPNLDSMGNYTIDYNRLIKQLTTYSNDSYQPKFKPTPQQITDYIIELLNLNLIGIVSKPSIEHFQNTVINVKSYQITKQENLNNYIETIHIKKTMTQSWQPSNNFQNIAKNSLLIDCSYTLEEISNFRCYWEAKGTRCNDSEWDYKFISWLKRCHGQTKNYVKVYNEDVGFQKK